MALKRFQFSKQFVEERCDFCGLCFHECPVLTLPIEQAQAEIRSLVERRDSTVPLRCTGCMACNTICPQDANPHTLIMAWWRERYERDGLPAVARLVLPYQRPSLFTVALEKLPDDEKRLVREWETNWKHPDGRTTMFYAGCNLLLQPFLLDSPLYGDIPAFGGLDLCCGEPLYRMGCWDAARAAAVHVKEEFDRMGIERIIVTCLAGYHMFRHVYPSVFGVTLNCEVVAIEEWLHDRIARGEIAITPLHKRVAIHDNCWPKASGDALFDKVRALLELLGVEVVEPAHTRETALCCGMCAGAARFKLRDILKAAKERIRELERTDADYVINYCGGCNWLFGVANRLSRPKARKPWYHLLELVQMAAGETPKHRTDRRARGIVSSMALPVLLHRLSPRRFRITEIGGRSVDEVDGSASRPASERELE